MFNSLRWALGRMPNTEMRMRNIAPEAQACGEHFGDLGLAHAGLAFEEQRTLHREREIYRGREAAVGDVIGARKQLLRGVDRGGKGSGHAIF